MIDDELNALLVQPLRQGARLHALVDACHSGTAIDLPFIARIRPGAPPVVEGSWGGVRARRWRVRVG